MTLQVTHEVTDPFKYVWQLQSCSFRQQAELQAAMAALKCTNVHSMLSASYLTQLGQDTLVGSAVYVALFVLQGLQLRVEPLQLLLHLGLRARKRLHSTLRSTYVEACTY